MLPPWSFPCGVQYSSRSPKQMAAVRGWQNRMLPSPAVRRGSRRPEQGRRAAAPKDGGVHLLANHKNRKRTRYRWALAPAASGRWRRRCRPALNAHGQDVVRLAVERQRSGTHHRLEILLDLETRRALLLDDGHRAIAMRAEGFHRHRVEHRAVGAAGERQARDDLAVLGTQNHNHRWRWQRRRVSRSGTRREQPVILRIQGEPVTPALVAEWIVPGRLHRLDIDGPDAPQRVLHDDIEIAFAVGNALLRHAAQIDRAEHG